MQTITIERRVGAPPEQVFDWCAVTTHWQGTPWVIRNRLRRAGHTDQWGAGALRVHLWVIGWFVEEITASDRPHSMAYRVTKSFPPSRHEGGTMTFTPDGDGTRVVWTSRVEMKIPIAADVATKVLVKPLLVLVFGSILRLCERQLAR